MQTRCSTLLNVQGSSEGRQVPGAQSEAALGGVIEREGPIHVSNVMILDAKGQPTRIKIEREDGKRFRVAKTTGARLD